MNGVKVICQCPEQLTAAQAAAEQLGSELITEWIHDDQSHSAAAPAHEPVESEYALVFSAQGVALHPLKERKIRPIQVDLHQGSARHRRQFGGGKGQMIAKAVGILGAFKPSVFDATAGLGGDAFVLASLGCQVTLQERSPVAYALLKDGLQRAEQYAETEQDFALGDILARMQLKRADSCSAIPSGADVIYLDPMFPERKKSAAVGKEMQAFHRVIGADADADALLHVALAAKPKRIVVKRPRHAPCLANQPPNYALEGKSSRFDIYAFKKLV